MNIKPIKSENDYNEALKRLEALWDFPESNEFEILFTLIEKYEEEHYPIGPPDPVEAIKFQMESMGLKQSDLAKYLGHKSRVSEILKGKRKLTLPMIRNLHKYLHIPADVLIREPR